MRSPLTLSLPTMTSLRSLLNAFLFSCLLAGFVGGTSTSLAEEGRPNVLFISVDDLKPELGVYGSELAKTPHMDRLAKQGAVMLNNHCQQAICAPSRMSMFTGLRPDQTKVWDLRTKLLEANPKAVTMQEHFKNNGYTTAGAGKIMHGAKNDHPRSWSIPFTSKKNLPYAEGFSVPAHDNAFYQGEKEQKVYAQMKAEKIKDWRVRMKYMAKNDAMPSTEMLDIPDAAYADGAMTIWAMDLLDQFKKSGEPFFLTVGYMKPHLPFVAPKKYWDLYDREKFPLAEFAEHAKDSPDFAYHKFGELRSYSDIPSDFNTKVPEDKQRELIHGYLACISFIDAQVGMLLDKLDELGLNENTIVVLWGDHGWHLGDHGMWAKHSNFEQATRSPLIISAPGFPAGQRVTGPTEFVDIFPTLLELAKLDAPYRLDGSSLVPALKDGNARVKEFAISQYPREKGKLMGYALRDDRYRLVMWMKNSWKSTDPYDPKLVRAVELYDYEKDPLETVNQVENPEYAAARKDLEAKMLSFFASQLQKEEAQKSGSVQAAKQSQGAPTLTSATGFIDLEEVDPGALSLRFAKAKKSDDGKELVVDFENHPKWPSVEFRAPEGQTWDLTGSTAIAIDLTNHSDQDIKTAAFVTNPGDTNANRKRVHEQIVVPAGAKETLQLDLATGTGGFDPSQLQALRIFVNKVSAPSQYTIHGIRAVGVNQAQVPAKEDSLPITKNDDDSEPLAQGSNDGPGNEIGEDGELYNFSELTKDEVALRFADFEVSEDGKSVLVTLEVSPKWPSAEFYAPGKMTWDLSGYSAVEMTLKNEGESKEKAFVYIANPGDGKDNKKRVGVKTDLGPGEESTLVLDLNKGENFDVSDVQKFRIFTGKHAEPVKFRITSVKAIK